MSALGQKQTYTKQNAMSALLPNSDRESGFPQTGMSALPPKADMCGAHAHVCFGPKADITKLGFHQRLDFTSLIVVFVAPLPFHCSPLSSSPAKQLG
jgi:hypothetical protein